MQKGGCLLKEDVIHSWSATWVNNLNRYAKKEGIELQKMILGMEILLHNMPKMVLMMVVALYLGILPQTLVTWLSFIVIRRNTGGLHAGSSITCTIMTLLMFVAVPYALIEIQIGVGIFLLIFVIIGFGLYRYSPSDTAARPILGKKKRARLKKRAVATSVFILALGLLLRNEMLYGLFAAGALYTLISVLPLTYKMLGESMNNYESYE